MREKSPYSEFFWSEFSRICTDYGEYTLRIQFECGKIRTRKNPNTDTFHVVIYIIQRKGYFLFAWIATNFTWICHSPIIFKCNVVDTHGDLSNFRVALSCFFKYFYLVIFIFTDSTKGAVIVSCKRMKGLRTKQNFSIILPTTFRISIHLRTNLDIYRNQYLQSKTKRVYCNIRIHCWITSSRDPKRFIVLGSQKHFCISLFFITNQLIYEFNKIIR